MNEYSFVNGSELEIGDRVLITATVTGAGAHLNLIPDGPYIIGDHVMWTWGGEYGSGKGKTDICRLNDNKEYQLYLKLKQKYEGK